MYGDYDLNAYTVVNDRDGQDVEDQLLARDVQEGEVIA